MSVERLTEMHFQKNKGFYMKCSGHCCKEDFSCEDCDEFCKIVDKLGAYEDTGLEPQEIIELKARMEGLCK